MCIYVSVWVCNVSAGAEVRRGVGLLGAGVTVAVSCLVWCWEPHLGPTRAASTLN